MSATNDINNHLAVNPNNQQFCLTKDNRLLRPADFQRVYAQKRWTGNREFVINLGVNDLALTRLGLVVSRKVSKKAVVRNRIKRQTREWFRQNKHSLGEFDIIITAKPSVANKTNTEIQRSLNDLWKKASKKWPSSHS